MSQTQRIGAVAAGRFTIEVGRATGMALERRAGDGDGDEPALATALANHDGGREPPPARRFEGVVDSAAEATARCEEATDLFNAALQGDLLQLDKLAGRADVMLELLQRLDRDGRYE